MSSLPSVEQIDIVLGKIEKGIKDVDSASGSTVRLMRVEVDLLNHLKTTTELLEKLLRSGNRTFLNDIFGDCSRVARLRSALNCIKVFHFKSIDNYPYCENACASLEQVMMDLGYQAQLEKAEKEQYSALLCERAHGILDRSKVEDSDDEPDAEPARQGAAAAAAGPGAAASGEKSAGEAGEEARKVDGARPNLVTKEDQEQQHLLLETRNLFGACDPDGDGKVTLRELQSAVRRSPIIKKKLKVRSNLQCNKLFEEADTDQSGSLDFEEFQAYLRLLAERGTAATTESIVIDEELVRTAFEVMDRDGNGQLDIHELRVAYAYIRLNKGCPVSRKMVAKWALKHIKKYDRDGTQTLSLDEFRQMLKNSGTLQETFVGQAAPGAEQDS
mmetsp:Transcript_16885/g.48036  ORF Transcript_16885/g.48036 Transcript_16885/m.48036 type:complete len:387 (+) Transcript_16885:107-1267(+)